MADEIESWILGHQEEQRIAEARRQHPGCRPVLEERDGHQVVVIYPAPSTDMPAGLRQTTISVVLGHLLGVLQRSGKSEQDARREIVTACQESHTELRLWLLEQATPLPEAMKRLIEFGEPLTGPNWAGYMRQLAARRS